MTPITPSRVSRGRRPSLTIFTMLVLAALAAGGLTALAVAKTGKKGKPLVKAVHSSSLSKTILVDSSGRTLYELSPETSKHLLCTSSQCLQFWPVAKVAKNAQLMKGPGVKGRLGRLHRAGFDQLTLDGRPLYRFSGDSAKGDANGQGIKSFGGTWHVVVQRGSAGSTHTGTSTGTTSTSTSSTYSYPGY